VNDRYMLKLFRRIEPGINPELEIGRFLTSRGFTRVPALHGALEYDRPSLEAGTLGVIQAVVKHQGSAWEYSIDELRRYYERVSARIQRTQGSDIAAFPVSSADSETPPPFFQALEHWYLTSAATLGRRTAELHATLADSSDPAFAPAPLDAAGLSRMADAMQRRAEATLDLLQARAHTMEAARAQVDAVLAARSKLVAEFERLRTLDAAGYCIRVHGDYHLG